MSKKGILQNNLSPNSYEYKELHRAAKDRKIKLVDSRSADINDKYDFTINRSYLEKCVCDQKGIQFNHLTDGYFWHNKIRQLEQLKLPCKTPKTIIGTDLSFNKCRELLGCPFIAKRSVSSKGQGVFFIKTQEDFDKATHCDIFQEVIWTSLGKDLRIWCIGGEVVGVMQRENTNSFKANVHQGGKGTVYPINEQIKNIATSIYKQTNLDFIGIDLLFGYNNDYYFCELNVNPGFEGFDKTFNIHIADKILEYIDDKIYQGEDTELEKVVEINNDFSNNLSFKNSCENCKYFDDCCLCDGEPECHYTL